MGNKKWMVLFFMCFVTFSYSQKNQKKEKIHALKVAFLTEKLELTSTEAQSFWPIYNEYQQKRESFREREKMEIRAKLREMNNFSEKQARALIDEYLSYEEEEEELDKDFLLKMTKTISAKKTLMLLKAEDDFKRELIKQYREKCSKKDTR